MEELGHKPIHISNLSSMFRREIHPNEKPYTNIVLKSNNRLIDEWEREVLKKICDKNGCIRDGQAWDEWQYFYTGKIIYQDIIQKFLYQKHLL